MTDDPKPEARPFEEDQWGVGQKADGEINVIPPDQVDAVMAEQDAREEALDDVLDGIEPDEDDGLSDLDEIEKLLGG